MLQRPAGVKMATKKYPIRSRGIVAYSVDDWRMEDLWTRAPGMDEVLVAMVATGVCHTDISGYGSIYPRVLGHEGAGRVLQIGEESGKSSSSGLRVDDLVILSAASCQACHYCRTGHPAYCLSHGDLTLHANQPDFVLARDPTTVIGGGYFGQSSFASPATVKVSSIIKAPTSVVDANALKRLAPLGCGIMTGTGAITNVAKCKENDVLAIVGLGGVGLAAVCAAKHLGVRDIIAVDLLKSRLELATELGATQTVLTVNEGTDSLSNAIRAKTPERLGCTHILDTSPSVRVMKACLEALRNNGTVLQVGVKPTGSTVELDTLTHMVHGRRLVGVIEGDRDPQEAIPELVQWATDGTLPVEKIFREFSIDEFITARGQMEAGEVIKAVLVW